MPNLQFIFRRMRCQHGLPYLIASLREHYGDVCSDGDVAVHQILDILAANKVLESSRHEDVQEDISKTLLYWWRQGECHPDVWHAT